MTDRPDYCCGKCPEIVGGGFDCTCRGSKKCDRWAYVVHENYLGECRYQPRLDTGERAWESPQAREKFGGVGAPEFFFGGYVPAVLYRSPRRAARVARREMRRRERARRNEFQERKDTA